MAITNPYSRQSTTSAASSSPPTISTSLTRQLLQLHHPNQRFHNDALSTSSELLRLFIIEARRRAAIEAECESEVLDTGTSQNSDDDGGGRRVEIRAEHVAKIAAELLMDLSWYRCMYVEYWRIIEWSERRVLVIVDVGASLLRWGIYIALMLFFDERHLKMYLRNKARSKWLGS